MIAVHTFCTDFLLLKMKKKIRLSLSSINSFYTFIFWFKVLSFETQSFKPKAKVSQCLNKPLHIDCLLVKLSRASALLFKMRNLVNSSILRTIYFALFNSHLNYCSLVWSQNFQPAFSHITLTQGLCSKKVLF